jgi:hypothetical protein
MTIFDLMVQKLITVTTSSPAESLQNGRLAGLSAALPDGGEDQAGEDGGADGVEDDVGELAGAAGEEALVELVAGGDEGGGEDGAGQARSVRRRGLSARVRSQARRKSTQRVP